MKVARSDEPFIEMELNIGGKTIQCRSIYLRPEGSKRLMEGDYKIFEHISADCIVGRDINSYGTVEMQQGLDT